MHDNDTCTVCLLKNADQIIMLTKSTNSQRPGDP